MSARPEQSSRFNFVRVESESILYDNETHNVLYLDQAGSIVWHLCDGKRDLEEIARLIADAYPEQREQIAGDVQRTVDQLAQAGALTLRP